MNREIYLDYAAHTPASAAVLDEYINLNKHFLANPNSSHQLGRQANEKLIKSINTIASVFHVKTNELIFTSGATEANNLAFKGVAHASKRYGKHIITSLLEHSSITGPAMALQEEGFEVDFVNILSDGSVDMEHFRSLLRNDTILVSIAAVDSEIGCRQDLANIYALVHQLPHCILHTDATQAIGKYDIESGCYDLLTCSAHKFFGLNGSGLLVCKENIILHPLIHGGISTTPYRSGTPDLPMIGAFACALSACHEQSMLDYNRNHVSALNLHLRNHLAKMKSIIINSPTSASPYILNISLLGIKSELLMHELAKHGIYVSTKSACCSVNTPSKPVLAMTKDRKRAVNTLRISVSHVTTIDDINDFASIFAQLMKEFGG